MNPGYDELTGLVNRDLLVDRLEQSLYTSDRTELITALVYVDLDRFTAADVLLDPQLGDALLKAVAHRLEMAVRVSDTVARMGGNEFVVMLTLIEGEANVRQVLDHLIAVLHQPYELLDTTILIPATVGLALAQRAGDAETLLADARQAMINVRTTLDEEAGAD